MKKETLHEFILITFAIFLISFAVYFFLVPSEIVIGSISGLSMVLNKLTNLPISIWTFILNTALLVIGFIFIGKEFGAKTVYTSLLMPVFIALFEFLVPITSSLTQNQVYDLVTYSLITAFGQALLFNANASSGGIDIVGKIISKYTHLEIGKAVTISGIVASMTSILAYDLGTLIVSILGTFANGLAIDYFIDGFNKKKKICILSDHYEEIQSYIMNTMKRGVTLYTAKGGFQQEERTELVTIMTKSEYKKLLDYLHKADFKCFVTVSTVNEVIGTWNINKTKGYKKN